MSVCHRKPAVQSSGDEDVASRSSLRAGAECLPPRKSPPWSCGQNGTCHDRLGRKIRPSRFGFRRSTSSSGLYISAFPTPERFADCDGAAQADLVDFMSVKVARTDMMPHHELLINFALLDAIPIPRLVPIACRCDVNPRRLPKASRSNQPG